MSSSPEVLLKLFMLLTMSVLGLKVTTPPNKLTSSDKIDRSTVQERYIASGGTIINFPNVMPSIFLFLTLALRLASSAKTPVCSGDVNDELRRLTPVFFASFLLVTVGACIRLLCFRTMGDLFTFEVTIRPNHKIVDSGPYAVVRHPSYTGAFMIYTGNAILVFSSQSPLVTCGWVTSSLFVKLLMVLWLSWASIIWSWCMKRAYQEEKNLHARFGEAAWGNYVKRVPYRYIPGIC